MKISEETISLTPCLLFNHSPHLTNVLYVDIPWGISTPFLSCKHIPWGIPLKGIMFPCSIYQHLSDRWIFFTTADMKLFSISMEVISHRFSLFFNTRSVRCFYSHLLYWIIIRFMIYLIFQGVMFSLWTVQSPLFTKMIVASVEKVSFCFVHLTTVRWFRAQYHGKNSCPVYRSQLI